MDSVTPPPARNRVDRTAQTRRPLERLLTTAGWTNDDLHELRAVPNDHLAALIAVLPPDDVATYAAWGRISNRVNLTPADLRNLVTACQSLGGGPAELENLIRLAQTIARAMPTRTMLTSPIHPLSWATAHLQAGNTAAEVQAWHHTTPAWLVAWVRTGHLADVPPTPVDENGLWAYIDAAAAYPEAPEAVLAVTVMHAPAHPAAGGTVTAWLATSWASSHSHATAA